MSISGLILFGSYARGDAHERSDVDLLAIVADGESLVRRDHDHLRIQLHTRDTLRPIFDHRSLFAWHLTTEGRIVYDDGGWLRTLFDSFALGSDYSLQRIRAGHLGWLLIDHGVPSDADDARTWIRTVMYVARTIALTRLAELVPPKPAFSHAAMCDAMGSESLNGLWSHKHLANHLEPVPDLLVDFLTEQEVLRPSWMTGSPLEHLQVRPHEFDPVALSRFSTLLGRPELGTGIAYI